MSFMDAVKTWFGFAPSQSSASYPPSIAALFPQTVPAPLQTGTVVHNNDGAHFALPSLFAPNDMSNGAIPVLGLPYTPPTPAPASPSGNSHLPIEAPNPVSMPGQLSLPVNSGGGGGVVGIGAGGMSNSSPWITTVNGQRVIAL